MCKILSPLSRALKHRSSAYRRFHAACYAWMDRLSSKPSYSQWGEDKIILEYLNQHGGIRDRWIYVDVGANHPTLINDTYLFYKLGSHGVCIEPNMELARLLGAVRPRDLVINAAVGSENGLASFYQTDNPVFSSLSKDTLEDRVALVRIVPMIALDGLIGCVECDGVFLLKTDTEGFDHAVLQGSRRLLAKTLLVLSETRDEKEREEHLQLLGAGWRVLYSKANTLFVNSRVEQVYEAAQIP